jgi:hypothetical protein
MGRGGRWPGALGPRLARDQRGAVAGAMAPAMAARLVVRTLIFRPLRAERCHQDPCRPHQQRPAPDPAGGKRPPWAGRALAGGFGPPAGQGSAQRCGRGDGPCHGSGERAFVGAGGTGKRTAFPRPRGTVPCRSAGPGTTRGQRPTRRARSARRGRGGRWPGALGPRLAWDQRSAVAGAMAPAMAATQFRPKSGREQKTHCVSPARAARFPVDRQVQAHRKPAPDPAGEKRPPGAGRALAGGFGPPAGQGSAWRCGRGDGPCHGSGERAFVGAGGMRKRTAFPRPCGTVPCRSAGPGIAEASARPGGREAPAGGGAGAGRGLWAPGWPGGDVPKWQGRWPLPWQRR